VDESIESNHSPLSLKLYFFSFLQGVAGGIWGFLSIFLLDLGGSAVEVGILSTVPGLASTFMQLAWGRISDRLGRSWRMVSTGFLFTSLLSIPVLMSTRPWQVILATGVQALLGSIAGVAVTVRLAEVLEPTRRARFMGIYNPLGFAGNIAGSFSAGLLIPAIGYKFTFLGYTVINLMIVILEFDYFSLLRSSFGELAKGVRELPAVARAGGEYTRWCLGLATRGFGIALFGPVLTVYLVQILGASKPQIGALNSLAFAVRLVASPPLGWVVDKKGTKRVMLIGVSLAAVYPVVFSLAPQVAYLVPIYLLNGLYWAFINASWFPWQMALIPGQRGLYAGFFSFLNGLAWAFGPLLGGFLGDLVGVQVSAVVSSLLILTGFALLLRVPERVEGEPVQL
jgi:MFS family permease